MANHVDFDILVTLYYEPLYQFALSLVRTEADACDLTQQTFCIWAIKGHQLRDQSKVKTWLFTTLHREFLGSRRKQTRYPQVALEAALPELPAIAPDLVNLLDCSQVLAALARLDENFQAPVALFYLQDYSYDEIAVILDVPIGTVKSRLARGLSRLHQLLADVKNSTAKTVNPNKPKLFIQLPAHSADELEPDVIDALELVKRDPELGRWLAEHCARQQALRAKFRQITVPAGLKEQIISERILLKKSAARRKDTLVGTLAVAAIILALIAIALPYEN